MERRYFKFRWCVIATNFIATAASGIILIAPSPLVGKISQEMGVDLGVITGITMLPFTLFVAIGSVTGGFFTDRLGVKKTYVGSIIITIIGLVLMPLFNENLIGIVVLRAIQGFGSGPILGSISRVAAEWFPPKERALVTGIQGAGLSLGIAIGFAVSPWIYSITNDWIISIVVSGFGQIVALIMVIIFAIGSKSYPTENKIISCEAKSNFEADFKLALKQPVFWITFLIVFSMSWITQAFNDLTPGHLAVADPVGLGLGPQMAGNIMSLYQIVGIAGSLLSGLVLEKIFKGKTKVLLIIAFLLSGFFTILLVTPIVKSNITYLLICLLAGGFLLKFVNPLCMAFVSKSYPRHITGKLGGMTIGLGIFGGTIGVMVGTFALHATGFYTLPIIIVSLICFIGVFLSLGVNPPKIFGNLNKI